MHTGAHHPPPSLPSIHHLHPDLPTAATPPTHRLAMHPNAPFPSNYESTASAYSHCTSAFCLCSLSRASLRPLTLSSSPAQPTGPRRTCPTKRATSPALQRRNGVVRHSAAQVTLVPSSWLLLPSAHSQRLFRPQNASDAKLNVIGPVIIPMSALSWPHIDFFAPNNLHSLEPNLAVRVRGVASKANANGISLSPCEPLLSSPTNSILIVVYFFVVGSREKYVTRAEYDDLKTRFDQLESAVARIWPAYPGAPHPNTMSPSIASSSAAAEPAHSAVIHPYRVPPSIGSPAYRMPSPPPAAVRGEPPFPASAAAAAPRSPQLHYRLQPTYASQARTPRGVMPSPPTAPRVPPSPSPPHSSSSRLPDTRAPGSRRASLTLAAITTPHVPNAAPPPYAHYTTQPKNLKAQTPPPLGQRLRTASAPPPRTGPAEEHHLHNSNSTTHPCRARLSFMCTATPLGLAQAAKISTWTQAQVPGTLLRSRRRQRRQGRGPRPRLQRATSAPRTLSAYPRFEPIRTNTRTHTHTRISTSTSTVVSPANHTATATLVAISRRFIL